MRYRHRLIPIALLATFAVGCSGEESPAQTSAHGDKGGESSTTATARASGAGGRGGAGAGLSGPGTDAWGPLVELRDDTATWPDGKPLGGWYVAPIHATLLPSGRVLITGWGRRDYLECGPGGTRHNGTSFVLDPDVLEAPVSHVTPLDEQGKPASDVLYCAGHAPMADGRVLYSGGSRYVDLGGPDEMEMGIDYARLFDPATASFARLDVPMSAGPPAEKGVRWYPTNTRLADGRMLVTAGFTRCCGLSYGNASVEAFDPTDGALGDPWAVLASYGEAPLDLIAGDIDYTHVFSLPAPHSAGGVARQLAMVGGAGSVLLFSHDAGLSGTERFIAPAGGARGARNDGASGALLSTGEILLLGGTDDPEVAKRADLYDPVADTWTSVDTGISRFHSTTVLLPDKTVLFVNGEHKRGYAGDRKQPQTFDPAVRAVQTWPVWTDDPRERGYHNFALLLKDGRVLLGGGVDGTYSSIACERPDVRIYEPGYLTKGPRPELLDIVEPLTVAIGGAPLSLMFSNGPLREEGGAVLMALGSVTHAFNQNQRYVPLTTTATSGDSVLLSPPASASIAPPGDYLLFLINQWGAPSKGKHVRVH